MKNKNYYIADTEEKQETYLNYLLSHNGYMAIDTETTSANPMTCELMGVSISVSEGEGFYFVVNEYIEKNGLKSIGESRLFQLRSSLIKMFENPKNFLIMHNSPFDVLVLRRTMGADCLPRLHADTILLKHTVDEQKKHGLKDCAVKYLGPEFLDEQSDLKANVLSKGGKWNKDQKDMFMADTEILGKYACADVDITARLFTLFEAELERQGLRQFYYNEEVHLLNEVVIDDMVGRGVKCDIPYFENLKKELETEILRLEIEAHDDLSSNFTKHYEELELSLLEEEYPLKESGLLFQRLYLDLGIPLVYNKKSGKPTFTKKVVEDSFKDNPECNLLQWKLGKISQKEFINRESDAIFKARKSLYLESKQQEHVINLGSTKQLKDLLFNRLGEKPFRLTKKGNAQVDDTVLKHFAKDYSFVEKLSKLRKSKKILSTYVEAVLTKNIDGIIHPGWMQFGTDSGRFACKDPNFQNLPRDDDSIKQGIIARDGFKLVGCDYAQLEPRVFSHYSREPNLIEAFKRGDDFYGTIAIDNYNLPCTPNEVKSLYPKERNDTKPPALGIPYGMKKWKLAKILDCSLEEAQDKIDMYWENYPMLQKFVNRSHGEAIKYGQVKTESGRIRRFVGIQQLRKSRSRADQIVYNKLLNLSINFKIQATAASIVNRAMIALKRKFKELGLEAYVLIQIHDEIVCEVQEDQAEQVRELMQEVMENTYKLDVPLVAEPKIGNRLSETK